MPNALTRGPVVLVILDGWGIAPDSPSNPISQTQLSAFDRLFNEGESARLWAHGAYVGLPKDQDGNSEAGHLNLGAGRIVKQDPVIILDAIRDGRFFKNPAFREAIQHVKRNGSRMHLMGMLSDGQSAHATPEHLYALLKLLEQEKISPVFIHLFTDGRDSGIHAARELLVELEKRLSPDQRVASIIGRFYAMDRKKKWERTEQTYRAVVLGEGQCVSRAGEALERAYSEGLTDEYVPPSVVCSEGAGIGTIQDNDSIIFFNHRSDRARQLTKVFVQKDFAKSNPGAFTPPRVIANLQFVGMTDFGPDLGDVLAAFPSIDIPATLPMVLSHVRQLYIAEHEKYAHMTYFFNGGYADPVNGEKRVMIPSPDVARYDEAPAMSTKEIAGEVVKNIREDTYDFIAANIACLDMVGHTGNFAAAQEALRATDAALAEIMAAFAERKSGVLIVTADHGNIEEMHDPSSNLVDTEHSKNQVPFVVWSEEMMMPQLRGEGILADVAPTVLELFGTTQPAEMTGKSLLLK